MHVFPAFEIRDYPEKRYACITETEPELMASVFLKASPGK